MEVKHPAAVGSPSAKAKGETQMELTPGDLSNKHSIEKICFICGGVVSSMLWNAK